MKKKSWPIMLTIILGIVAVIIWILGNAINQQQQARAHLADVQSAFKQDRVALNQSKTDIKNLYQDDDHVFLRADLSKSDLDTIENNLNFVELTSDSLGVTKAEMPKDIRDLQRTRDQLIEKLAKAKQKYTLQSRVNSLFTQPVKNWQKAENNVAIRASLTEGRLSQVSNSIKSAQDNPWRSTALEYISYAQAQLTRVSNIKTSLSQMLVDDKITEAATYQNYLNLTESIEQVRNEDLKNSFTASADKIARQLNAE